MNNIVMNNIVMNNIIVDRVNYEYSIDDVKTINNSSFIVDNWDGPIESDNSFSGELWFKMSANAPTHCMLISCRSNSVSFGGWNLQIVGGKMGLQIGNGQTWCGISSSIGPDVLVDTWHHASWLISNSSNKAEMYLDGVKYEDNLPSNYVKATNQIIIGALDNNNTNFRFYGQIKDVKLGAGLVPGPQNLDSITDIPVQINELDISSFINILDQYTADKTWIQQAVTRLRQELKEEMDLNQKLTELDAGNCGFLVSKVEQFMTEYSSEITGVETELQQIYDDLQRLISENSELMNNNKALKDRMTQLNSNGTDQSIINIRQLIDNNIQLLKDNNRWGDTKDSAFKFNI